MTNTVACRALRDELVEALRTELSGRAVVSAYPLSSNVLVVDRGGERDWRTSHLVVYVLLDPDDLSVCRVEGYAPDDRRCVPLSSPGCVASVAETALLYLERVATPGDRWSLFCDEKETKT